MLRFYLAGAFPRRAEFIELEAELEKAGYRSTARWLQLEHSISNEKDAERLGPEFSGHDRDDVHTADVLIFNTNPHGDAYTSGGRHVEFGIALDRKPILVFDPHQDQRPKGGKNRENIFHWYDRNILFGDTFVPAVQIVTTKTELLVRLLELENILRRAQGWTDTPYTGSSVIDGYDAKDLYEIIGPA